MPDERGTPLDTWLVTVPVRARKVQKYREPNGALDEGPDG